MKTTMRGPYTGPRGGVYYIDANGNKQYGPRTRIDYVLRKRGVSYGRARAAPTIKMLKGKQARDEAWGDAQREQWDIAERLEAAQRAGNTAVSNRLFDLNKAALKKLKAARANAGKYNGVVKSALARNVRRNWY